MEKSVSKTECCVCEKETRIFTCQGCLKVFCRKDLTKHWHLFDHELEQMAIRHNEILQMVRHERKDLEKYSFIKEINQWENESIERIQQIAEQYRTKLIQYTKNTFDQMENRLNHLAKNIQKLHEDNDFNEIDLKQIEERFLKLEKQLLKPINISIQRQSVSSTNQIPLISLINQDTQWKQFGVSVAAAHDSGNELNQLNSPTSIFIDHEQTIYIADRYNHRIVQSKMNAKSARVVAGGNGQGNKLNQLNGPISMVIDKETNTCIIADRGNRRVMQWSCQNNTTNGEVLISNIDCCYLTIDKDGSLYVSDSVKNEVKRWKRGEREGTIVAGGNGQGDQLNQFHCPTSVFVDDEYSLYVLDRNNHRVMKWVKGAKEGIVVAGGNGQGGSLSQLSKPEGINVDSFGQIYVADTINNRVVRWREGEEEGKIVVGGNYAGKELNQFSLPACLSFDEEGSLYVADLWNHRIQKFEADVD